ncbi:MAG: CD1845 family protein [Bacillota bacterium]
MRIILKIIAAPFAVILTIAVAMFIFLFFLSEKILGLMALFGIAIMIFQREWLGGVFLFLAFLASPMGIPAIAEWLLGKLYGMNQELHMGTAFIRGFGGLPTVRSMLFP